MKTVYLVCGVSGSGKSWAARQVADRFHYIAHDRCWRHPKKSPDANALDPRWEPGAVSTHLETLVAACRTSDRPVLTECPFAERVLREQLEAAGIKVIPVFVIEPPHVVAGRYKRREGKEIPKAALTRATTIRDRAREWRAFHGTSDEVLAHLKEIPL